VARKRMCDYAARKQNEIGVYLNAEGAAPLSGHGAMHK